MRDWINDTPIEIFIAAGLFIGFLIAHIDCCRIYKKHKQNDQETK